MSDLKPSQGATAVGVNPTRVRSGAIHDVLVGAGKDAYMVDLDACSQLITQAPAFQVAARATRLWLLRAVEYLAGEQQVSQFAELGSGYPCSPNLHEVTQKHVSDARTLYLDHDAIVAAHGRALLTDEQTYFMHADLSNDTEKIITKIKTVMDPRRPIAVCMSFVAEFLPDPATVVDAFIAALPCGSYVVLSHVTGDVDTEMVDRVADIYSKFGITFRPRSRGEIAALLAGCDLIEPGLVAPHRWRPVEALDRRRAQNLGWEPSETTDLCCYAAVAQLR